MIVVDKKQFQQILIMALGDENRTKFVIDNYTFKNYIGEPVTQTIKLRCVQNVLETFLSVVKQDSGEFATQDKEKLTELLRAYQSELAMARDRKEYHKKYYKERKGQKED